MNTENQHPEKYSAEYYAQMLGGGDTTTSPEQLATQEAAGDAALAGAEVSIKPKDDVVRAGHPVHVDRPAPIVVTEPGVSAYRHAGLTPGGARFGVDQPEEQ